MKDVNEAMKQLQMATKKLGNLHLPGSSPWGPLQQMQQVFNQDFWQNINHLTSMAQSQTANPGVHDPTSSVSQQQKQEANESHPKKKPKLSPSLDLFETLSRVIVCLEVAGLERNSLKLSVVNESVLTLRGKIKKPDLSKYLIQQERAYGMFSRQISLPAPVRSEGVKTTYKDGLLEIHLIKKSTQQPAEGSHLDVDL